MKFVPSTRNDFGLQIVQTQNYRLRPQVVIGPVPLHESSLAFAPLGLGDQWGARDQGLTPLAIDLCRVAAPGIVLRHRGSCLRLSRILTRGLGLWLLTCAALRLRDRNQQGPGIRGESTGRHRNNRWIKEDGH
jgi:hypothetical protein